MKRYIHTLVVVLAAALGLSSCLKDDDTTVTLYDDMAITEFELTTVKQILHTTDSYGEDSTYTATLSTLPDFSIDHYKGEIYNTDSLPTCCDLAHVLVSITSKNSGTIVVKSLTSDTLNYYSSTDSIDFTQPREIRVYALDGSGYRAYTVTLNMRQTEAGVTAWQEMTGKEGEAPATLQQDVQLTIDGTTFRLTKDGGNTWTDEQTASGEDPTLLPTADIAWATIPYVGNVTCELLVGQTDALASACTVWRKINDTAPETASPAWVNIPLLPNNPYYLPKQQHLNLVWFNDRVLAIGNDGKIYESRDQGITWKPTTKITLPEDLDSHNLKAATDDDGNLWIRSLDSGRVWKGWVTK